MGWLNTRRYRIFRLKIFVGLQGCQGQEKLSENYEHLGLNKKKFLRKFV